MASKSENHSKANIRGKYETFLANVSLKSIRDHKLQGTVLLGRSYGANNAVLSWSGGSYQETITEIKKSFPKISEKTIGEAIKHSVKDMFEKAAVSEDADPTLEADIDSLTSILDEQNVTEGLEHLIDALENEIDSFGVVVPIEGIELETDQVNIGEISLFPHSSFELAQIIQNAGNVWGNILADSAKKTIEAAGSYVVVKNVEGEQHYAIEEAIELAQNTIHILNFYAASCRHRYSGWRKINILGQPSYANRRLILVSSPKSVVPGFSESITTPHSHKIDDATVSHWKQWEFDKIVACFTSNQTQIEQRIKRSVTWYSKAVNADGLEEQFVALATALECLVIGDEGKSIDANWGSINQRMSERVALLLGKDLEERRKLIQRVKKLYQFRSKIVHEGLTVSMVNLYDMEDTVKNTILCFTRHLFKDWQEFLDWEFRQKFHSASQLSTEDTT